MLHYHMNKNTLLDILGESSTLRMWIAQQLVLVNYPMPSNVIEGLLAESPVFRAWALDQFDGEFLVTKDHENLVDKTIDEVKALLRTNKIRAIKFLRDESKIDSIREGLIKEFASFVRDFKYTDGGDVIYASEFGPYFTLNFSRKLVEYIEDQMRPF